MSTCDDTDVRDLAWPKGRSGLGLAAQRKAVEDFLNGGKWRLVDKFTEIESGKQSDRPALAKAFRACRLHGAKLVIAKLDRLSRDAHFLLGLEKAGVGFVAADMPHANRLTGGIMAMVAHEQRRMISKRTREALARKRDWYASLTQEQRTALRRKGKATSLGGYRGAIISDEARQISRQTRKTRSEARAADLAPVIAELQAAGVTSLSGLARGLVERGIPTARGGSKWTAVQVSRVLARLDA